MNTSLKDRIDRLRARVDIVDVIGAAVKLGKGGKPRGQCPFHGSKSDSLAVDPENWRARCWGCGWTGDAIAFVRDHYGLSFMDALRQLEGGGTEGLAAAPVRRVKRAVSRRGAEVVESVALGRHLWKAGRWEPEAIRIYLRARSVPDAMLSDRRLADFRFVGLGPIVPWPTSGSPGDVPQAPAMVALVRRMPTDGSCAGGGPGPERDLDDWPPVGVHVTWLKPDLTGKMERSRRDGSPYPARKMLGPVGGGGVWLPGEGYGLPARAPLFVGEGHETTLSGMSLCGAGEDAWGLAVLSLDNLQGAIPRIRGAIPLFDPRPVPQRLPLCFAHRGIVTGLIDADMKPLAGPVDRATGKRPGEAVIEQKGGPIVRRILHAAERAHLCSVLFTRAWRSLGCDARAVRPRMGKDFNDMVKETKS
jgi:DNA primase